MIPRIYWSRPSDIDLPKSPFATSGPDRILKFTFDSETLDAAQGQEAAAVQLLHDLSNLDSLKAFDVRPGTYPHIKIDPISKTSDIIPVRLTDGDQDRLWTGISMAAQWPRIAAELDPAKTHQTSGSNLAYDSLIRALAHEQVGSDIFVTLAPSLLRNVDSAWVKETNPRTPTEAASIVGSYLRNFGDYRVPYNRRSLFSGSEHDFFWSILHRMVPSLLPFIVCCQKVGKEASDLAEGVRHRLFRALQAKDALGLEFYAVPGRSSRDRYAYHLEYLTLLLWGAFDSAIRAVNKVVDMRTVDWRKPELIRRLRTEQWTDMAYYLEQAEVSNYLKLLSRLRNLIHSTTLQTQYRSSYGRLDEAYLDVPQEVATEIARFSSTVDEKQWGINSHQDEMQIEPFTFGSRILESALSVISRLLDLIDFRPKLTSVEIDQARSRRHVDSMAVNVNVTDRQILMY